MAVENIKDGEFFTHKGVGRARIRWPVQDGPPLKIDVFTTHLISYTDENPTFNDDRRYNQALLSLDIIKNSDADVKIFLKIFLKNFERMYVNS